MYVHSMYYHVIPTFTMYTWIAYYRYCHYIIGIAIDIDRFTTLNFSS